MLNPVKTTVPNVVFKTRVRDESVEGPNPYRWQDVSTEDIFAGKKVVVLALPGAFTPTCSSTHLPGYEAKYEEFREAGVDEIYCLSVNDAFTMFQWGNGYVGAQGQPGLWRPFVALLHVGRRRCDHCIVLGARNER